jgi:K+-transporting ATPase KdpF subunit
VNPNARSFLSRYRLHGPADLLGVCESLRQALRGNTMDYILTGLASAGLFAYLLYALLKPERF